MTQSVFFIKLFILVAISFIVATLLAVSPLPFWALWFKPPWVLVTLIFWIMVMPSRINVGLAFALGLLIDGLNGGLLGQHAFAFVIVTFLMVDWYRPMRLLPAWQQALLVVALVSVYQFILFVVQAVTGNIPWGWHYWLPTLLSLPIWLLQRSIFLPYCRRWLSIP